MQRPKMIQKKYLWFRRHQEPKKYHPTLSQESPDSFPLLADTAELESNAALPNTQPSNPPRNPPKSLPDLIAKPLDSVDCPIGETNGEPNGEANDEADGEAVEERSSLVDETEV